MDIIADEVQFVDVDGDGALSFDLLNCGEETTRIREIEATESSGALQIGDPVFDVGDIPPGGTGVIPRRSASSGLGPRLWRPHGLLNCCANQIVPSAGLEM